MSQNCEAQLVPSPLPPKALSLSCQLPRGIWGLQDRKQRGPENRTGSFKLLKGGKRRNLASFPKLWMLEGVPEANLSKDRAELEGEQIQRQEGPGGDPLLTDPRGTARV